MALCWGPVGRRPGQAPRSFSPPAPCPLGVVRRCAGPSVRYTALEPRFCVPVTVGVLNGCFDSPSESVRARRSFRGLPPHLAVLPLAPGPAPFKQRPLPPLFAVMGVLAPAAPGCPIHSVLLLVSHVGVLPFFPLCCWSRHLDEGLRLPKSVGRFPGISSAGSAMGPDFSGGVLEY
ncbi:hypothetical protein NDU88_002448 [Pleurodeles waltl]|uniref:Uncharacterized protein n=1 Tax=Pleurodeles waltl TaxID=8319 RepID=A0AAV7PA11_PLEWA|nr:hypothetical protein NDU88_002448 [Pleurodeles waltl]